MPVTLDPTTPDDHTLLARLWQLYAHDLSEFRGSMPDAGGLFKAGRLPSYLHEVDRCGYLLRDGDVPVGFAFVRGLTEDRRVMGEFFVVRAARGNGLGRDAAVQVLRRHPGRWEVPFQEENPTAARFWRRVATEVAGGSWTEEPRPVPDKPWIPPDVWLTLATY